MLSTSQTQSTCNAVALKYAIQHDVEDIDTLDEFLADDAEDCIHVMLGNAGCFY